MPWKLAAFFNSQDSQPLKGKASHGSPRSSLCFKRHGRQIRSFRKSLKTLQNHIHCCQGSKTMTRKRNHRQDGCLQSVRHQKDGSWQAIRIEKDEDLQRSLIHTDPLEWPKITQKSSWRFHAKKRCPTAKQLGSTLHGRGSENQRIHWSAKLC